MIAPDDPRHGSTAGYMQGCRDTCCSAARRRYSKRLRLSHHRGEHAPSVPIVGFIRRVRALQAIGHSSAKIAGLLGITERAMNSHLYKPAERIRASRHADMAALYDRLSMTVPAGRYADQLRDQAAAKGWAPPLAWNEGEIDNPDAQPHGAGYRPRKTTAAA